MEYGNLYRFVASLGVIAVAASVVLPWLFINSLDVLLVTHAQLDALTPTARGIILLRQRGVAFAQVFIVPLAAVMLLAGAAALWWSISRWSKRQQVEDEKDDVELLRARGDFESAKPEDVDEKDAEEATALVDSSPHEPLPDVPPRTPEQTPHRATEPRTEAYPRAVADYRAAEERVSALLHEAFVPAFDVSENVRSKGGPHRAILDFLIDPTVEGAWGPIGVELKLVSSQKNLSNALREGMLRLAEVTSRFAVRKVYTGLTGESPAAHSAGVVVVVLNAEGIEVTRMRAQVRDVVPAVNSALRRPIGVVAVSRKRFDDLSADNLRAMIASALLGEVVTAL